MEPVKQETLTPAIVDLQSVLFWIINLRQRGRKRVLVALAEICYCRAEGSYTRVYLKTGKSHLVTKNLKWVQNRLPGYLFYRCHRSCLVNLNEVENIDFEGVAIAQKLYQIPVSKRKFVGLFCKWNGYKEDV